MPKYEITRADGSTTTLVATGLQDAVLRHGASPEPVAARLLERTRSAADALADQPRHLSFVVEANQIGQCPVPGCDALAEVRGELHQHMLDVHGWSGMGESKGG